MKKHLTISLISVLAVFAQSCAPTTAVRVLSLSYEGQPEAQPINNTEKLANRFNGPKRADEETYIFPGDILTFTVELEDPNFEFISLLAIKFNGQTIRANSDDSVVSTRDCGVNLCVDFPFEIQSGVTQYKVEEVKFAKISLESGVNAIIDNNSSNFVDLNVWSSQESPYISQSVLLINDLIDSYTLLSPEKIGTFTGYKWNNLISSLSLSILHPEDSPLYNPDPFNSQTQIALSDYYQGYDITFFDFLYINWAKDTELINGFVRSSWLMVALVTYNSIGSFAYHEGNKIYLNYKGESYLIIELFGKMRLTNLLFDPIEE